MTHTVPLIALFIFAGLAAIVVFSILARYLRVPYPVIFVIGGAGLAFIPHVPHLNVNPDWIFLVVLPPLLFSGGWNTDVVAFRRNLRPIALLAIGLVLVTTGAVAGVARLVIHGIPWAAAFTLGAIVAPPDPVAAETVMQRLVVSQRIATIVSSEGLMNDAVSLVLFSFATAAMVHGSFSIGSAVGNFIGVTLGGIAIGLVVGLGLEGVQRLLQRSERMDSLVNSLALLVGPYASYLPADAAHVSGVLAAVTAGMYLGHRSVHIYDAETRVTSRNFWEVLIILVNGGTFLLIGFELRETLLQTRGGAWQLAEAALALIGTIILVRFIWVFVAAYVPRALSSRLREDDPFPGWRSMVLVAWAGLRGIVSLAAALSVPLSTAAGTAFPYRFEIIFLSFCVIFATLVGQGFTLRPLVLRLRLSKRAERERLSTEIRIRALQKGLERVRWIARSDDWDGTRAYADQLRAQYERRIGHLRGHIDESEAQAESHTDQEHHIEREALKAEVGEITRLRAKGEIPDEVFREIQYDLDLAFMRIT